MFCFNDKYSSWGNNNMVHLSSISIGNFKSNIIKYYAIITTFFI